MEVRRNKFVHLEYFISAGEKKKMYTLRVRGLGTTSKASNGHICSLSTDFEKAVEKAKRYVARKGEVGDQLRFDQFDVNDITRRSSEEIEQQKQWHINKRKEERELRLTEVDPKCVPFGKFKYSSMADVYEKDAQYAWWVLDNFASDHYLDQPFIQYIKVFMRGKKRIGWMPQISEHVGNIKEKVEFEGVVEFKYHIPPDQWGGTKTQYKFRLDNGNVLVTWYSGSKWSTEVGTRVKGKGFVKTHSEYKNEKQTIIKRVTLEV